MQSPRAKEGGAEKGMQGLHQGRYRVRTKIGRKEDQGKEEQNETAKVKALIRDAYFRDT